MTKTLLTIVCFVLLYYAMSAKTAYSSEVIPESQYERIVKLRQKISDTIKDRTIAISRVSADIRKLENLTKESRYWYIKSMERITNDLWNRREDERAVAVGKEIIAKASFLPLGEENLTLEWRADALSDQLSMLLTFRPRRTELAADCNPVQRQKNAARLLELYQLIVTLIEEDYDPNAPENNFDIDGFTPPASHKGTVDSGADYSNAEDKATRDAYKKYIEEEAYQFDKRRAYGQVSHIKKHYPEFIQRYLIDAYSTLPYRTAELEQMLKEKNVDAEMTKEVLDAVRKAERENPDDGFRIWQSQDKLFKTTAKLISADAKRVVLEKRDGKRTGFDISALRQEDQDYVKEQSETKREK